MKRHFLTALLAVLCLAGCPDKGKENKPGKGKDPTKDQSEDQAFQSFTGRLRVAVARHDLDTLTTLMAPDFGYRWDEAPPGETPFIYWDRHRLWGELNSLMQNKWVPYESYMVVPPALAEQTDYHGYRAGVRMVNGSWRLAYFVPAPPAEATPPPPGPPLVPDAPLR